MPLTCACDWDQEFAWYYIVPNTESGYSTLETKISRRCASCKELIKPGSLVVQFDRYRDPRTELEEAIHGEEYPLAPYYHCEKCGDLWWSFRELGFECIAPDEDIFDCLERYKAQEYEGAP